MKQSYLRSKTQFFFEMLMADFIYKISTTLEWNNATFWNKCPKHPKENKVETAK